MRWFLSSTGHDFRHVIFHKEFDFPFFVLGELVLDVCFAGLYLLTDQYMDDLR